MRRGSRHRRTRACLPLHVDELLNLLTPRVFSAPLLVLHHQTHDLMMFMSDPDHNEKLRCRLALQVSELKRAMLRHQRLRSVPNSCWRAQFYTQGRLLSWLRGRSNNVTRAATWAVECIEFLDGALDKAQRFESARYLHHDAVHR